MLLQFQIKVLVHTVFATQKSSLCLPKSLTIFFTLRNQILRNLQFKKNSTPGVLTCHSKAAGGEAFHHEEQHLGILAGGESGNQCRRTGLG